jgi:hypothetical protein
VGCWPSVESSRSLVHDFEVDCWKEKWGARDAKERAGVFLLDGAWPHSGGDSGKLSPTAVRRTRRHTCSSVQRDLGDGIVEFHVKEIGPLFPSEPPPVSTRKLSEALRITGHSSESSCQAKRTARVPACGAVRDTGMPVGHIQDHGRYSVQNTRRARGNNGTCSEHFRGSRHPSTSYLPFLCPSERLIE